MPVFYGKRWIMPLLVPLLRSHLSSSDRFDGELAIYRDQLGELEREQAAGTLERFVPLDDPLSNMSIARKLFLGACAPVSNVHPMTTDLADPDLYNDAAHNARLIANAEHYYRIMYYGSRASWNLRDGDRKSVV